MVTVGTGARSSTPMMRTLLLEPDDGIRGALELELTVRGHEVTKPDSADIGALVHDHPEGSAAAAGGFDLLVVGPSVQVADLLAVRRMVTQSRTGALVTVMMFVPADAAGGRLSGRGDFDPDVEVRWPADAASIDSKLAEAERFVRHRLAIQRPGDTGRPGRRLLLAAPNGIVREAEPVVEAILGYPPETLTGINAFSLFHLDDTPLVVSLIASAAMGDDDCVPTAIRVKHASDAWRVLTLSVVASRDQSSRPYFAFHINGPEARVHASHPDSRGVTHDPVTHLPNMTLFVDRVEHALARATRRGAAVAVLTVDVNQFVPKTGSRPRDASDALIVEIAQRLRTCLRDSDTAARLGYDEFGLLLDDMADRADATIVAERVVDVFRRPFIDGSDEVELMVNIGIATNDAAGIEATDMIRNANSARAWASVDSTVAYVTYNPSVHGSTSAVQHDEYERPSGDLPGAAGRSPAGSAPDSQLAALHERMRSLEDKIDRLARLVANPE